MMNTRQRWNGTGVPTQSHPQAASLTLSAWNKRQWLKTNCYMLGLFVEMQMWRTDGEG
jgi:hypothetical protein